MEIEVNGKELKPTESIKEYIEKSSIFVDKRTEKAHRSLFLYALTPPIHREAPLGYSPIKYKTI